MTTKKNELFHVRFSLKLIIFLRVARFFVRSDHIFHISLFGFIYRINLNLILNCERWKENATDPSYFQIYKSTLTSLCENEKDDVREICAKVFKNMLKFFIYYR